MTENIKKYLDRLGLSIRWLSKHTGIAPMKLSLVFRGKRKLTAEEYKLICRTLNVSMDTFLEETGSYDMGILSKEYERLVVETDSNDPTTVAEITRTSIDSADGYRVRLKPVED